MLRLLTGLLLLFIYNLLQAQEYNYKHFTTRDGLPSNTVYAVRQDKDGFIWIATDAGVSRFDGREFVNFGTQDGLPTSDIIYLFPDSKGRVWMSPIRNTLCYYYKGKIYNAQNDSLVRQLIFNGTVFSYSENLNGEIIIGGTQEENYYIISPDNKVTRFYPSIPKSSYFTIMASHKLDEGFMFNTKDKIRENNELVFRSFFYHYKNGKTSLWLGANFHPQTGYVVRYEDVNGIRRMIDSVYKPESKWKTVIRVSPEKKFTYSANIPTTFNGHTTTGKDEYEGDILLFTDDGVLVIDSASGNITEKLLPGKRIARGTIDKEQNTWIPSLKDGLYILSSKAFRTLKLGNKENDILSLNGDKNKIYAGSSFSRLYILENSKIDTVNFGKQLPHSIFVGESNRIVQITRDGNDLLLSQDAFILRYNLASGKQQTARTDVIKSIVRVNKDTLLVATGRGCLLVHSKTLQIIDTIYKFRTYSAVEANNAWYVGSAGGLYKIRKDKSTWFAGSAIPALENIINNIIVAPDNSLWIGTYGGGLVHLRNDSVEHHFTVLNGLTSNNCKSMFADGRFLWVGTEKGLNRIDQLHPEKPIVHYTITDGLPSNDILSVYIRDKMVYAGTPEGLTFFDSTSITTSSSCYLNLLTIQVGKNIRSIDSLDKISYKDNDFRFDYTGISFKSLEDIRYIYRLVGLKDTWDSTNNTSLSFLALSPGNYELQIFAVNKFGVKSQTLLVPFYIKPPFWATWWFRILVACAIVALVWWLIVRRIRQEQAKAVTQNRINELEQQALRSQMNPHFIFNCLNSIQNFLLHNNFEKTNEYLTSFAHLIRQTLDNSSRENISLASEVRYLTSYLDLESMRFAHSFEHSVSIDPGIDADNTHIPPMILQPYVENSIRHGLRYKQDGVKCVKIRFERRGNTLLCIVEDNGVGRKKAGELKSFMHVEYQSKGMRLTAERIEAMNRRNQTPITVNVVDMEESGNATGTQVVVRFPNVFL